MIKVFYAFTGCGKTYLSEHYPKIIDLKSSNLHYLYSEEDFKLNDKNSQGVNLGYF